MADSIKGNLNTAFEMNEAGGNDVQDNHHKTDFENVDLSYDSTKEKSSRPKIVAIIIYILKFSAHLLVGGYFGYATYHYIDVRDNVCWYDATHPLCGMQFCSGYGMLVLLVAFVYFGLFYYLVFKPKIGRRFHKQYMVPFDDWWMKFSRTRMVSTIMIALLLVVIGIFLFFETKDNPGKLRSLVAPCFFILMGYVFSAHRNAIKWRTVITGIACQFLLGIVCIRWEVGRKIFECIGNKVADFLSFADSGSRFVFGDTIIDDGVFAFAILPVIFFFSFFISILYYIGAMQWVVIKLGWILQQIIGTTVCESVTAAANIFLGMSESPLLIRPYIEKLTASEIHSIMVSGFATVSGTVLAAYLSFGASPAHLITSSVMAAPATLAISNFICRRRRKAKPPRTTSNWRNRKTPPF